MHCALCTVHPVSSLDNAVIVVDQHFLLTLLYFASRVLFPMQATPKVAFNKVESAIYIAVQRQCLFPKMDCGSPPSFLKKENVYAQWLRVSNHLPVCARMALVRF